MSASTTVILILLALAGVAVVFVLLARRDPGVQRRRIAVDDIGRVYAQISAQAVETSFAVLIIPAGPEENPEIQFSVEDGKAGLDPDVATQHCREGEHYPLRRIPGFRMAGERDERVALHADRRG